MIATFRPAAPSLDRVAIALSGLCLVHCLATTLLIGVMATAGGVLGDPIVHRIGLALAAAIGGVALIRGVRTHRRLRPALLGTTGIATMATALLLPHGARETLATIVGVALVAIAHAANHRGCMAARHG